MSEGYTVEDLNGSIAGIVVRQSGDRAFRFFSSSSLYDAMDGHLFVSAQAAQRAAHSFAKTCAPRRRTAAHHEGAAA